MTHQRVWEALVTALVRRLQKLLPQVELDLADNGLAIRAAGMPRTLIPLDQYTDNDAVADNLAGVMSTIQDAAAQATREPWPDVALGNNAMALPEVVPCADRFDLRFVRSDGTIALELEPIAIDELDITAAERCWLSARANE